jgi:hypothetical protein
MVLAMDERRHSEFPRTPRETPRRGTTTFSFVVQVQPDWSGDPGTMAGRVQQLSTGDGGNFGSSDDLLAFIRQVLDRVRDRDEADPPCRGARSR